MKWCWCPFTRMIDTSIEISYLPYKLTHEENNKMSIKDFRRKTYVTYLKKIGESIRSKLAVQSLCHLQQIFSKLYATRKLGILFRKEINKEDVSRKTVMLNFVPILKNTM